VLCLYDVERRRCCCSRTTSGCDRPSNATPICASSPRDNRAAASVRPL